MITNDFNWSKLLPPALKMTSSHGRISSGQRSATSSASRAPERRRWSDSTDSWSQQNSPLTGFTLERLPDFIPLRIKGRKYYFMILSHYISHPHYLILIALWCFFRPFDSKNPYLAPLRVNRELHKGGDRSCLHIEFDIEGSKMRYDAGKYMFSLK